MFISLTLVQFRLSFGVNRMLQNLHDVFIFQSFLSREKKKKKTRNHFSVFSREYVPFVLEYSQCIRADSRFHLSTHAWFWAAACLSVCRFCRPNLEASFYAEKGLSIYRATPTLHWITILGMTHLHRRRAKLVFLRRVSLTPRGTSVNAWPRQRGWSSLTETMPLIQETLWPATPPCANLTQRTACLLHFSVETARGNVVFIINNPSEWMLPRKIACCLSSVSTLCFLFWNIHLTSENKRERVLKTTQHTVWALSLKAVFALQRADNLGLSGRGCEISKDFQLFTEDERDVSKATENPVIQQQEQEQIVGELQILRALLSKHVAVILQVGLTTFMLYVTNIH